MRARSGARGALLLLALRAAGEQLGWGFQLQNPMVVAALALLGIALLLAYTSSVLAAAMSAVAGYALVPLMNTAKEAAELKALPEDILNLQIPQIMPVMSALFFSVMIGLAAVWTKAKTITAVLDEFQKIVLKLVEKVVIPVLPFFIACTFACLAYDGTITKQLPVFLMAVVVILVGHFIWMAVLYGVAGAYSGKNPKEVFKYYGPAYLTAVGTMFCRPWAKPRKAHITDTQMTDTPRHLIGQ